MNGEDIRSLGKGFQCSIMDELEQIRILNLKSWIIASLHLEYKEVL
jgi:hypothetical protein